MSIGGLPPSPVFIPRNNTSNLQAGGFLRFNDYQNVGQTRVNHNIVIAICTVSSRILAAMQRSYESKSFNELRETLTREIVGYSFYFLVAPALLRFIPQIGPRLPMIGMKPEYRDILFAHPDGKTPPKGLLEAAKYHFRGLFLAETPSPAQLNERRDQILKTVQKLYQQSGLDEAQFKTFEKGFDKAVTNLKAWRLSASVIGWVSAIALLGISVTMFNIAGTKKRIKQREEAERLKLQQQMAQSKIMAQPISQTYPMTAALGKPMLSPTIPAATLPTPNLSPAAQYYRHA